MKTSELQYCQSKYMIADMLTKGLTSICEAQGTARTMGNNRIV